MNAIAQIVEMDQERDRKTCLSLDLKVTGANRELAQWVADHRGRYSCGVVARWLGCSERRIGNLREWAEGGFKGTPHNSEQRQRRDNNRHHDADGALKTNNKSESDDDFDPETGEIARPEVLYDNILHAIGGMNENARIFNRLLKVSALDREAGARIITAIDRMMGKWRSIQSNLEKKG